MTDAKILLYDVESLPNICTAWQLGKQYVTYENILRERELICCAYKWLGDKTVHSIAMKPDTAGDWEVIEHMHSIFSEADILVAHNGDRFDLPMFNARAAFYGLSPLPSIPSIDTLKVARKVFRFNSNRLDYLGAYLGCGRKLKTSLSLWLDILAGRQALEREAPLEDNYYTALNKMVRYNKQDVLLLEKVYLKLRPYMRNHPNVSLYNTGIDFVCPNCGSDDIQARGYRVSRTGKYKRFCCNNCGGWSSTGVNEQKVELR